MPEFGSEYIITYHNTARRAGPTMSSCERLILGEWNRIQQPFEHTSSNDEVRG